MHAPQIATTRPSLPVWDSKAEDVLNSLDASERRYYERFGARRARSGLVSRMLIAQMGGTRLGALRRLETGQLKADGGEISVSHASDRTLAAVGCCPMGVDLEAVADLVGVPERAHKGPGDEVHAVAGPATRAAITWTLKEAYVKMLGHGLEDPREVRVRAWATRRDLLLRASVCGEPAWALLSADRAWCMALVGKDFALYDWENQVASPGRERRPASPPGECPRET